ncbi:putative membrane transporter protein [Frankia sp. AiPs1]|uniref:sulfite exporter TauE/SafE family protein n=1 Tax=Frankia sp. AiPa1 TaxID=573492 RepID=UPI00202B0771|nr:sulfite exporter TauE/SafE family protein [Frankia sp. AiPa1]MCL9760641.1 sulfite exporter TauE/SafE family protein [Frankia sp. AiPa1]
MGPGDALLTIGAGLLAGAVNAIAGGGTLIAFPALLATGLPALTANITSSVGLLTGYAGGALGYRRELADQVDRLRALGPPALLGGVIGAVVLLATPSSSFRAVVPYLVLASCLLLAAQTRLAALVARRRAAASAAVAARTHPAAETPGAAGTYPGVGTSAAVGAPPVIGASSADRTVAEVTWPTRAGVLVAGVYGSYFGAGLGVLLLGVLGILLSDDLQRTNGLKTLLAFGVNGVGVVVFLVTAKVAWGYAGILVVASLAGGLIGARIARRMHPALLRAAVITLGVVVATVLIIRR